MFSMTVLYVCEEHEEPLQMCLSLSKKRPPIIVLTKECICLQKHEAFLSEFAYHTQITQYKVIGW